METNVRLIGWDQGISARYFYFSGETNYLANFAITENIGKPVLYLKIDIGLKEKNKRKISLAIFQIYLNEHCKNFRNGIYWGFGKPVFCNLSFHIDIQLNDC